MPAVEQVTSTLPHAFRDKHPSTFAIVDGSEVFIETPSDLECNHQRGVIINIIIQRSF